MGSIRRSGLSGLLMVVGAALAACGSATSVTRTPAATFTAYPSPTGAAAAYAALAQTYNTAEVSIQNRESACDLATGDLAKCRAVITDDLNATQLFQTGLRALSVNDPAAQAALATMVRDQDGVIAALRHAVTGASLLDISAINAAEVLPANRTVHHDSIVLRTSLGLPIPTEPPAPSPT